MDGALAPIVGENEASVLDFPLPVGGRAAGWQAIDQANLPKGGSPVAAKGGAIHYRDELEVEVPA